MNDNFNNEEKSIDEKKSNEREKLFLKQITQKKRKKIFSITMLSLIVSGCSLAFAYLTKYIVNSATIADKSRTIAFIIAAFSLLTLKIILKSLYGYSLEKTASEIFVELRQSTFTSLMRSDYARLSAYHSGELINRLSSDVAEVAQGVTYVAPAVAGVSVQLAGTAVLLFTIDYKFALLFIAGAILAAFVAGVYRLKIKASRKAVLEKEGQSRSFMQDNLTSVITVRAYGAEKGVEKRAAFLSDELFIARLKRAKISAFTGGIYSFIGNLGLIFAIIYFGAGLLVHADYGSVTAVILLLLNVQQPISGITSVISSLYARSVSAARILEVAPIESEVAEPLVNLNDELNFLSINASDLTFSYGQSEVLSDARFKIRAGEKLCVVGESGAGKSTLLKLLLGVYKPSRGKIGIRVKKDDNLETSIGVEKIDEYSPTEIGGLFAYVPQGNFLIAGTVKENLTFFSSEADDKVIYNAIDAACARFVYDMRDGINAKIGERGGGLSEGQIQRLAIARALVSNRQILLFDEATSALDEQTEREVIQNICALKGKTCVFITHRNAVLDYVDTVYRIENGKIIKKK